MQAMAFVARPTVGLLVRARALGASSFVVRRGRPGTPPQSPPPARPRARLFATAAPPPPPAAAENPDPSSTSPANAAAPSIKLLYDGDCPLCLKEVRFLRARNDRLTPPPISFVDIADDEYSPADNGGIDFETAMGRIHGITNDGEVLVGVPVFRRVYEEIGLGWVYAATSLPVVGPVVDWVYDKWADRRLAWTGRPRLEEILEARGKRTCR